MKKNIIAMCFVFTVIATASFNFVNASEISGSLSSESYQGSMSGNVVSAPVSNSGGGGGGGGSIILPYESFSYGNVMLFSQPMIAVEKNTVENRVVNKLAQLDSNYENGISTDTATTEEDFVETDMLNASETIPTYDQPDLSTDEYDITEVGEYDFFGISAWFWLILLLIIILIIAVLYMQRI